MCTPTTFQQYICSCDLQLTYVINNIELCMSGAKAIMYLLIIKLAELWILLNEHVVQESILYRFCNSLISLDVPFVYQYIGTSTSQS